ncbi:MAG: DM13 domain-containing protein [Lewinella sp.]|nr:DM13 domain-containing protein [Lewinella sp.]
MKNLFVLALLATGLLFTACDDETTMIIDSSMPTGQLTVERSGTFTAQNGTPTQGTAELGMDEDGVEFLHLDDDFMTELGTGTATVYFSTSDTYMADPGNGNPDLMLVGVVHGNGENFYRMDNGVDSRFTHVIIWCDSAGIPFGYANLQ